MAMLVTARVMTAMRQCSLGATRAARWAAAGRPSLAAAAPAAAAAARPGQLLVVRAASSMDNNISSQLMEQVGAPQGLRLRCLLLVPVCAAVIFVFVCQPRSPTPRRTDHHPSLVPPIDADAWQDPGGTERGDCAGGGHAGGHARSNSMQSLCT